MIVSFRPPAGLPLPPIGSQALEDFTALEIEDSEADRSRRPVRIGRGADRGGGVGRLDFRFEDNRRAATVGDGEELKPEPLPSCAKNSVQFVQRIYLGKRIGGSVTPRGEPAPATRAAPSGAIGRRRREYDRLPRLDIVGPLATPQLRSRAVSDLPIPPQPKPAAHEPRRPTPFKKAISSRVKLHNRAVHN